MLPPEPSRNAGIDMVRGASILLVVTHHLGLRVPLAKTALASVVPTRVLDALCFNGYEAVFVFFVVSGFLIAGAAIGRWGALERIEARAFYARRFARIAPCLLLLIAVLCLLDAAGFADYAIVRPDQSLWRTVLAALFLHLNWYEGHTWWLPGDWGVLWSLSIEEAFYLGFPLVCLLARSSRTALVVLLAGLALSLPVTRAALADNHIWREKAYLPGMAAIATGVLAALLAARFARPPRWVPRALGWLGAACVGAILFAEDLIWPVLHDGAMLLLTGGAACLLLALHWQGPLRWAVRGAGWLRSCGRLSYEIYLTHMFVVFTAVSLFRSGGGDMAGGWLWFPPVLLLSWALGWLVARFVSVPADAFVRRVLLAPAPRPRRMAAEPG